MPPNYQHLEAAQIPKLVSEDQKVQLNIIAGSQKEQIGLIKLKQQ